LFRPILVIAAFQLTEVRSALQAKQPKSATGIRMVLRGGSILFDIDGTLVDSTAVVERSWRPERSVAQQPQRRP
jgi:hypothetical protein